jgi:predicted DNA-binding transcriptional regulator YafY
MLIADRRYTKMASTLNAPRPIDELHTLLRNGEALTAADIVDRLDIDSKRHARRLLRTLRENHGLPMEDETRGREKAFFLPPEELVLDDDALRLTERQALALTVAAESGRAVLRPTPLFEPLEQAFDLLLDLLDAASHTYDLDRIRDQWHFDTTPAASTFGSDVFRILVRALNERRRVHMTYAPASASDAPPERTVTPLVMAAPGSSWRCVAYCHYREAPRDFTLSRIETLRLGAPHAGDDPVDDFDAALYFRERFGDRSGDPQVVRLRVKPDDAHLFREKAFHPTQVIEEEREDGALVVSFDVSGLEGITSWIRSWGAALEVLDPPALREQLVAEAEAVLNRYRDG